MKTIELVIPAYNEEESLSALFAALDTERARITQYEVKITFVNDGSKDKTRQLLEEYAKDKDYVTVITNARNFGHQAAVTAGLDHSTGDAVIIMDADLQDPPSLIHELIAEWEKGFEVVYAQRRTRQDTFFKKLSASLFYRVLEIFADIKIPRDTGDFRLIDKKVVTALNTFREHNRFLRGMVSYVGFKQKAVLFDRAERFAGQTHYPLKKMVKLALDAITSFSTVPLQMITQVGLFAVILSILGSIYVLAMYFLRPDITVSGWTTLMISVLFMGGIQMLMLGIIGTYVGRIYQEVQGRPIYIVADVVKGGQK